MKNGTFTSIRLHAGNYQIGRLGWTADFNDGMNFLETYRDKEGGNNDTNWENAKYKEPAE